MRSGTRPEPAAGATMRRPVHSSRCRGRRAGLRTNWRASACCRNSREDATAAAPLAREDVIPKTSQLSGPFGLPILLLHCSSPYSPMASAAAEMRAPTPRSAPAAPGAPGASPQPRQPSRSPIPLPGGHPRRRAPTPARRCDPATPPPTACRRSPPWLRRQATQRFDRRHQQPRANARHRPSWVLAGIQPHGATTRVRSAPMTPLDRPVVRQMITDMARHGPTEELHCRRLSPARRGATR